MWPVIILVAALFWLACGIAFEGALPKLKKQSWTEFIKLIVLLPLLKLTGFLLSFQ